MGTALDTEVILPHIKNLQAEKIAQITDVYNVYTLKKYPVKIKKVDSTNLDSTLAGAEFDLYGPYDAERTPDTNAAGGRKETKVNKEGAIVVDSNGIGDLGNLESGIYYLYETKAPDGFNMLTEPVVITVDSKNQALQSGPVSYVQMLNGAQTTISSQGGVDPVTEDGVTTYILTLTNSPGVVLPSTGGTGTTLIYTFGSVLLILAVLGFVLRGRKRDW